MEWDNQLDETALTLSLVWWALKKDILRDNLPDILLLKDDFSSVYVDAGSLADKNGLVIRLAMLVRESKGNGVDEKIYYPYLSLSPKEVIPAFVSASSITDNEKIKQPLSYVIELASLISVAMKPEQYFENPHKDLILVRHGPLIQVISQYFTTSYTIEKDLAVAALKYAGLDDDYAKELAEDAEVDEKGRVILGLLLLNLIIRMMEIYKRKGYVFAGVVEDVRESKIMVAHLITEFYADLYKRCYEKVKGGMCSEYPEILNESIKEIVDNLKSDLGKSIKNCLCIEGSAINEAVFIETWSYLIKYIESKYIAYETSALSPYVKKKPVDVEATLLRGDFPLPITDEGLFYMIYFLSPKGKVSITKPFEGAARIRELNKALANNVKNDEVREKMGSSLEELEGAFKYIYLSPIPEEQKVKCEDLKEIVSEPCEVARMIRVPSPIRVEYLDTNKETKELTTRIKRLISLTYYSSLTMGYAYPPQLLIVDKYSRVNPADLILATSLIEKFNMRVRPLSIFAHGWSNRRNFI